MNWKFKLAIAFLLIIFLALVLWFRSLNVTEGYVFTEMESNPHGDVYIKQIWVVESEYIDTHGKNQAEIIEAVEEQAANAQLTHGNRGYPGTFYKIPWTNDLFGTDFELGDKVTIYWHGVVMQSSPGKIRGTVLILKGD